MSRMKVKHVTQKMANEDQHEVSQEQDESDLIHVDKSMGKFINNHNSPSNEDGTYQTQNSETNPSVRLYQLNVAVYNMAQIERRRLSKKLQQSVAVCKIILVECCRL